MFDFPSPDLSREDNHRIACHQIRQVMSRFELSMDDVVNGILKLETRDLAWAQKAFDAMSAFSKRINGASDASG